MTDIEIRSLETEELEFRAAKPGDGKVGTFSGYAARYNSPSLPLPFTERIAPGAFARTLKSRNDVRMYVNHDDRLVLASTRSKTLRLEDRAEGLWVEADLPDVSYARDLRQLIEDKVVSTMSFGFSTVRDAWSADGNERTLNEVRLHEVSVVTGVAAYPATTAAVRNMLGLSAAAHRAQVDVDELAQAIARLGAGDMLSAQQVQMLSELIGTLAVDDDGGDLMSTDMPDMHDSSDGEDISVEVKVPLSILSKQMDLLSKQL